MFRGLQVVGGVMVILRDWRFESMGFVLIAISLLFQVVRIRKKPKVVSSREAV
jgi:hypothetical protein